MSRDTTEWVICDSCGNKERASSGCIPVGWYSWHINGHPVATEKDRELGQYYYVNDGAEVCSLPCLAKMLNERQQYYESLESKP